MKKQQMTAFYLEALLLVLVFVAMILVLTGVFGAARVQSREARLLNSAVTLASNGAEAFAAAGSPEALAAILDENGNARVTQSGVCAGYEEDLSPSAAADAPMRLELSWEKDGAAPGLVRSRIRVSASGSNEPLYTLETAAGKEAAS